MSNAEEGAITYSASLVIKSWAFCSISPELAGFGHVQPFVTLEEKACFGRRKTVRKNSSGNFVPISRELARTWTPLPR
jgi:hypothetical protein